MLSDVTIMSNLYLIIYFDPIANDSVVKGPSIYGGLSPYFNVISDSHAPQLEYFNRLLAIKGIPETISADHSARMYFYTIT
jgi:hypothetical protein